MLTVVPLLNRELEWTIKGQQTLNENCPPACHCGMRWKDGRVARGRKISCTGEPAIHLAESPFSAALCSAPGRTDPNRNEGSSCEPVSKEEEFYDGEGGQMTAQTSQNRKAIQVRITRQWEEEVL